MGPIHPDTQINLAKASIVVIDGSPQSLEVTAQILKGFDVTAQRFQKLAEARKHLAVRAADLILVDPSIEHGAGYQFVSDLRSSGGLNSYTPIVLTSGHVKSSDVAKARDSGANFVVAKPLSPSILLQRIMWVIRDKRPFVQGGDYLGPERRFRFMGPPRGSEDRRRDDPQAPLGEANEPNLSQDEVEAMIKQQRVMI